MDDLKIIKQQVYEDGNIETILRELGCEYISQEANGTRITAQLPSRFNSHNKRSVQVKNNESLTSKIWTAGVDGDIYAVVGYILYDCVTFSDLIPHLNDCKRFICEVCGYDEFLKHDPQRKKRKKQGEWNGWLKEIKKKRRRDVNEIEENKVLPESVLDQYYRYPNYWWKAEGISFSTQRTFEVAFDLASLRIVFPIRDRYGRLIGVKGRYVGDDEYTLSHMKYMYLYPCNKSIELFNLHRALPYIMERKEVIVFESEKSVMLAWEYGFRNAVSIGGSDITPVQVQLLKDLGLEIVPVFAWDKDRDRDFIKKQLRQFKGRPVYTVYDVKNILTDKDSPIDKGYDTWYYLYTKCRYRVG